MSDGTLVCGFVWRTEGDNHDPQAPVYLTISRDQGETWTNFIRLPDGQNPRNGRGCWSHYGSIREIEPGRLLVLYDVMSAGWTGPVRYVASREIQMSL